MSSKEQPLVCADCGATMNHHATKIDYRIEDAAEDSPFDGGVLQEVHTCPNCGHIQLRRA